MLFTFVQSSLTLKFKINRGVKINGGGGGGLQISKQLSNHTKGCQNKRNKEKICNVTKTIWKINKQGGQNKLRGTWEYMEHKRSIVMQILKYRIKAHRAKLRGTWEYMEHKRSIVMQILKYRIKAHRAAAQSQNTTCLDFCLSSQAVLS